MRAVLILCLAFSITACGLAPSYRDQSVPIASTTRFDPDRYLGAWVEVARFPTIFQSGCDGAIAEYGPAEGGVTIRNLCLNADGEVTRQITGSAELVGPGRLSVRLQGVPFAAPYWVLWTDEDYRIAVVGVPNGRSGWILGRAGQVTPELIAAAEQVFAFNGYDISQLERSVMP